MDQSMRRETHGWLDILGNGEIMKKVLQPGRGRYSRPQPGQIVKIHIVSRLLDGTLVNEDPELSFTVGNGEVIQELDVAVRFMEMREKALFKIRSKVEFIITLLEATDAPDLKLLPPTEKIDLATCKKEQGNVLDQHRDLKPRNNTIRDEVSTMMKKDKTHNTITFRRNLVDYALLIINGDLVEKVWSFRFLGVHIQEELSWATIRPSSLTPPTHPL
ncbi:peptidyl-prolyl cis-trans isomerase FKBP8-like [Gouania willdenowi]|uniref:peptidyl-prolyl cis-trans isomerase FKBP8-like n=1 Tax=Gouania willdenowi TaxID=441366 RepID=UPI001056A513|nr:peptidyl-prolyl cis-trans isomerase FKBP8-like [Gouania willdenowi]